MTPTQPHNRDGFAIGPILFVLALMGVIAIAMGAGNDASSANASADRVVYGIFSQAETIRAKIHECYAVTKDNPGYDYPASNVTGTVVTSLTCPGDTGGASNLWTGQRPGSLGAVLPGFDAWVYINAGDSGGRCIRIQPTGSASKAIKDGLARVIKRYTTREAQYDSGSMSQRFILWITRPTGAASSECAP
ncbi:MAG: hypothetical protein IPI58_07320 [Alphaproteobacteria bacterium]|nr:MAG: hypothetical protein IPI58_07320 [Alphaproteobacteria bacterium]